MKNTKDTNLDIRVETSKKLASKKADITNRVRELYETFSEKSPCKFSTNGLSYRYGCPTITVKQAIVLLSFIKGNRVPKVKNVMEKMIDFIISGKMYNPITVNLSTSGVMDAQHRLLAFILLNEMKDELESMFKKRIVYDAINICVNDYGTGDEELRAVRDMQNGEKWDAYAKTSSLLELDDENAINLFNAASVIFGTPVENISSFTPLRITYAYSGKGELGDGEVKKTTFKLKFSEEDAKRAIANAPVVKEAYKTLYDLNPFNAKKIMSLTGSYGTTDAFISNFLKTFGDAEYPIETLNRCLKGKVQKGSNKEMTDYLVERYSDRASHGADKGFWGGIFNDLKTKRDWITNSNAQKGMRAEA